MSVVEIERRVVANSRTGRVGPVARSEGTVVAHRERSAANNRLSGVVVVAAKRNGSALDLHAVDMVRGEQVAGDGEPARFAGEAELFRGRCGVKVEGAAHRAGAETREQHVFAVVRGSTIESA